MGKLLDWPPEGYKTWAIKQRMAELQKAIIRHWTKERQDELDNLKKDLDGSK